MEPHCPVAVQACTLLYNNLYIQGGGLVCGCSTIICAFKSRVWSVVALQQFVHSKASLVCQCYIFVGRSG
jgi:hypothetical protein